MRLSLPRWLRAHAWLVACVLWTCLIWGHSLVPGAASTLESDGVAELSRPLFGLLGIADLRLMTLLVRKSAHLLEYAVLGLLAQRLSSQATGAVPGSRQTLGLLLVPFVDEALQLLVPGRSGMLSDVVLDLAGMLLGLLVVVAWRSIVTRRSTVLTEQ